MLWLAAVVPRYDKIGIGYATHRQEDPRIAAVLWAALGDARSVVNVGAGAGSYEPPDRQVIAVEPSAVMLDQRGPHRVPGMLGRAECLPLAENSVDAAMAVLTVHHWPDQQAGLAELLRVARQRIVLLTLDPDISAQMWLMADYAPEIAALDYDLFPAPESIATQLGGGELQIVPVPADCRDGFLLAFWAHPERVLDPYARAATSGFARMPDKAVSRVTKQLRRDLDDGTWNARNGHLLRQHEYDAGLRLVTANIE